ncbi:MAG TPA: adenylate/guanylate cyclase domain-containing protein [Chthoniobacterales bacterium]|nr:adenylate/guanylate cyclase domain-containing protein [Chthoniobacterales bacterium]
MASERSSDVKFAIGHVLFIDIVGYSKLLMHEQTDSLQTLKEIVRGTEQVRAADAAGKLLRLPAGDGGALVFRNSVEAPVICATEISRELKKHPELRVRMGIHSGPVNEISDLNEQANIAGAGINIAQRVMNCGDAGHILLSKHVAEDLEPYARWNGYLHSIGECEVKHGQRISLVNFYGDDFGNSAAPQKCAETAGKATRPGRIPWRFSNPRFLIPIGLILLGVIAALLFRSSLHRATSAVEKSIAVLPFENLSRDPENAYFADGVQDEILTALAKVADLKVISRTSVIQYKSGAARNLREIGKQLGVAHLLEGSVQRAVNRVRINAQLIDARTDAHIWAQTYDRELADVFAIQTEIAKAIAGQLQAKILPQEKLAIERQPTNDLSAYDFYSQASQLVDRSFVSGTPKQDLLQGVALLEKATARDPNFVLAYCKLSRAHDVLYLLGLDHSSERLGLAEQAVNTAVRLQPDAPEVHLARATHLYSKLDYAGAQNELELTQRALPNDPRALELKAYIDRRQGRWQESLVNLERAIELDPNNVFMLEQIATSYGVMRQFAKAIAMEERILSIKPENFENQITAVQLQIAWKADPKPMHALLDKFMQENPGSVFTIANSRIYLAMAERDPVAGLKAAADLRAESLGPDALQQPREFYEALFAYLNGDDAARIAALTKARTIQQNIVDRQPDYAPALAVLGQIDALLGRKDDAIREGQRAVELLPPSKDAINGSTILDRLAIIYAWVGEKDRAIEQLEQALRYPGRTNYGQLKLFPQWDPLRGDPRFEKIVASLAPNEAGR